MGEPKGNADIWKKLGSFIEKTPVEADAEDTVLAANEKRHEGKPGAHNAGLDEDRSPSELKNYYHNKARAGLHPHMAEKMQHKAMEHINSSIILARKGHKEGARIHIELAESAMHTASRFMSHEEYAEFEKKVDEKLDAIMKNGHK